MRHTSMKLNGWQRLWVVTAALWAVLVVCGSYVLWPPVVQFHARETETGGRIRALTDDELRAVASDSELQELAWKLSSDERRRALQLGLSIPGTSVRLVKKEDGTQASFPVGATD